MRTMLRKASIVLCLYLFEQTSRLAKDHLPTKWHTTPVTSTWACKYVETSLPLLFLAPILVVEKGSFILCAILNILILILHSED